MKWLCVLALVLLVPIARAEPTRATPSSAMGDIAWGLREGQLQRKLGDKHATVGASANLLRGAYAPGKRESVLSSRAPSSRTFYFFVAGKLTRMFTVFDALAFPEGNFAEFVRVLERRFGPARPKTGELAPGYPRAWVEWHDGKTRLRAIDETKHAGFYCLLFDTLGASTRNR